KEFGGKNAFPFVSWNGTTFDYHTSATIEKTDRFYDVAITQTHQSYEGRPIIHEYTLSEFADKPNHLIEEREKELGHYAHLPWVGAHEGGEHGDSHDAHAAAEPKLP